MKAAAALGVDIADCLVFEDAEAGIAAGEAAGADVVVVTAAWTHPLETAHPTLSDYADAELSVAADGSLTFGC
ncbi:HAD-IA family hydrolase [Brevundimonas sp.]|uniref:HAD-IA family hydrolase n=1 Tax=Brevundimonas sp. TaxID=1871086 RepID=UPI003AFF786A